MPTFSYVAVDSNGKKVSGQLTADNQKDAIARIRQLGQFPAQVTLVSRNGAEAAVAAVGTQPDAEGKERKRAPLFQRISTHDMAVFSRQLANLVKGGLPIIASFSALIDHTENLKLKETLMKARSDVEAGSTLHEALGAHPRVFSPLYVNMVRAGEASGELPGVLEWLADLLEKEQARRTQIRSALAYPILLVVVGTGAVAALITFLIPQFKTVFEEMNQALPLPTQVLMTISDFVKARWWLMFGIAALIVFGVRQYGRTPRGRFHLDSLKLRVPILGKLWHKMAVARLARTLSTLLRGGVPILDAMEVVRGVLGNEVLARAVEEARARVREGEHLAESLRATRLFPPLLVQMLGVGEQTGDLDGVLNTVANTFDVEVDSTMKSLLSLLEPVIILGMGGLVAGIIMAMLLPIFQMNLMAGQ
ncbi:MAG: type II secretion system F family protein [Abditibacteriales bacterium]|nr:type II secretion system F family protein [Abditibacteriales bacterium]MDW8365595.1 type II secretion system F family protein [Abditibacteriales bacterium]